MIPDLKMYESGNWMSCLKKHSVAIFDSEKGPLWKCIFISNLDNNRLEEKYFQKQCVFLLLTYLSSCYSRWCFCAYEMQHLLNMTLKRKMSVTDDMVVSAKVLPKPLQYYLSSNEFSQ